MNEIDSLLPKIFDIYQKHNTNQNHSEESFNILHVVGVEHYELKHSSIIAELLDPNGSHNMGCTFLDEFLKMCIHPPFEFNKKAAVVKKEKTIPTGRTDIEVVSEGKAIIIENKIYAKDGKEQIKRYAEYAKNEYGENNFCLIYLTLYGNTPSDESSQGENCITLSYAYDLAKWISKCESCCEKKDNAVFLKSALKQYKNLIIDLTGVNMTEECKKEIIAKLCNSENIEVADMIAQLVSLAKSKIVEDNLVTKVKEYAENRNLLFEKFECESFHEIYSGFKVLKKEWKSTGIFIGFQFNKSNFYDFFYGVGKSNNVNEEISKNICNQFSFPDTKSTNYWICWDDIEGYKNWKIEIFKKLAAGDEKLFNKIKEKIDSCITKIDSILSPNDTTIK